MKFKIGFTLLLCAFFFTNDMSAQKTKGEKNKTVQSFKLKSAAVAKLKNVKGLPVQMDKAGTVKPAKGYHILQSRNSDGLFVVPSTVLEISKSILAATSQDLGNGIELRCIGCQECQVVIIAEGPGGKNYGCAGSCPDHGCNAIVHVPSTEIMSF